MREEEYLFEFLLQFLYWFFPLSLDDYYLHYGRVKWSETKKVLWFFWNFAHLKIKIDKFSQFSSFLILLKKCGKKSDSSLKIGKNYTNDFPVKRISKGTSYFINFKGEYFKQDSLYKKSRGVLCKMNPKNQNGKKKKK